jgi:hypothetical protein
MSRSEYLQKWYQNNKNRLRAGNTQVHRKNRLKTKYGLTLEQYNQMFQNQGGVCKICDKPPPIDTLLCVDHCHRTKKNRGLLCKPCNLLIGNAHESIAVLESAIKYIKGFE